MQVIIGIDPHNATHTAVAVSGDEDELGRLKIRAMTRPVARPHGLEGHLVPGGTAREINVSNASLFLAGIAPATAVEQIRYDLANDLLDDIRRLDVQLNESHKKISAAVRASSTSVTELFVVGPMTAAILIGNTSDIRRIRYRDH